MAATVVAVSPEINEDSVNRLQARTYSDNFTAVPNRVLTGEVFGALSSLYKSLTGNDLPPEANTYLVKAEGGIFQRLYCPQVFRNANYESGEAVISNDELVIRWGEELIPLKVGEKSLVLPKGLKAKFSSQKRGKYDVATIVFVSSAKDNKYRVEFTLRSASNEEGEGIDPMTLDTYLEDGDIADFLDCFQPLPDPAKKGGLMRGEYIVKLGYLPLGRYNISDYRVRRGGKYGPQVTLEVEIPQEFIGPATYKKGDEWVTEEKSISEWARVRPNSKLANIFLAEPVVNSDNPVVIDITEHGDYNGHPTTKFEVVQGAMFEDDETSIKLNF